MACLLALSLPEHDEHLATVQKPIDVGCVRCLNLCDRVRNVLVRRLNPGFCNTQRSEPQQAVSNSLWNAGHGLAWVGSTLAPLRDGISTAGRASNAFSALRAYDREL